MGTIVGDDTDRTGQPRAQLSSGAAGDALRTARAGFGHIELAVLAEYETARVVEPARHRRHRRRLPFRGRRAGTEPDHRAQHTDESNRSTNHTTRSMHHLFLSLPHGVVGTNTDEQSQIPLSYTPQNPAPVLRRP